jgi:NADPH:quinone reductase-like Zn-dependent oxidoreductase
MRRVQYLHYGAPEELRLDEVAPPDAGQGQILVQVRAAAANPTDWKIRRGEIFHQDKIGPLWRPQKSSLQSARCCRECLRCLIRPAIDRVASM